MQSSAPIGVQTNPIYQTPQRPRCTRETLCYPCGTSSKTNVAALACITAGTTLMGVSPEVGRGVLTAGQVLNALVLVPTTARVLDGTPVHRA